MISLAPRVRAPIEGSFGIPHKRERRSRRSTTSFQAYLDTIEAKTGKTPNEFVAMAREKGFDAPKTKAGVIVNWLKEEYVSVAGMRWRSSTSSATAREIADTHVGSAGPHRDESTTLRFDGTGS